MNVHDLNESQLGLIYETIAFRRGTLEAASDRSHSLSALEEYLREAQEQAAEDRAHVLFMKEAILHELSTGKEHGGFVHAMARRDFGDAYRRADSTNRRYFAELVDYRLNKAQHESDIVRYGRAL